MFMDVLKLLHERALELSQGRSDEDFEIRGLWKTDLMFRPNANERTFDFTYVLAQTVGQGCSYCNPSVTLDESLIGMDARSAVAGDIGLEVAILDAVFTAFRGTPAVSHTITGTSVEKTPMRTKVVADEVAYQIARCDSLKGAKPTILNIGVVGNFIKEFAFRGYDVLATDFDVNLVGNQINGVPVSDGDETIDLIGRADVAVATGMTLATRTLGDIIETCQKHGTRLVLFAETGANFGEEYCRLGIDAVVSEPFPFYIFQGTSVIDVFRRREE